MPIPALFSNVTLGPGLRSGQGQPRQPSGWELHTQRRPFQATLRQRRGSGERPWGAGWVGQGSPVGASSWTRTPAGWSHGALEWEQQLSPPGGTPEEGSGSGAGRMAEGAELPRPPGRCLTGGAGLVPTHGSDAHNPGHLYTLDYGWRTELLGDPLVQLGTVPGSLASAHWCDRGGH